MAARSALVVVGWIEQRDEEVLTGRELDLFVQQVEDDEERPSRDFTLLGDAGPQATSPRLSPRSAAPARPSCRRAASRGNAAANPRHLPACGGAGGSRTVTRSPPAARGVMVRVPSCAWVMVLTIASPRPTPAWSERMRSVPRRNGSASVATDLEGEFSPVFSTGSTAPFG